MREGRRVDDNAVSTLTSLVDPVDDLVLSIALVELDVEIKLPCHAPAIHLDVRESLIPIDRRLALSQQVQVGAVQDVDDAAHCVFLSLWCVLASAKAPDGARRHRSRAR